MSKADELARQHWSYVCDLVRLHEDISDEDDRITMPSGKFLEIIGHHYRTAMVHGYKHGQEDAAK